MSSINAEAGVSRAESSTRRNIARSHKRWWGTLASIIGGFFLTGFFLALSGGAFALSAIYGFVWFAQHH